MKAPDRIDVAQKAAGQALAHPGTWAPFLPIAAAFAFLGAPWWACLPLMLVVATIVCIVWSRWWGPLTDKVRNDLLASQRTADDVELTARVQRVALAAAQHFSSQVLDTLRETMAIKRAIEDRLYADAVVTPQEEEIGVMVGELVRTLLGEAETLALSGGTELSLAASARFHKAAETLRRVHANLDLILDPVPEDMRLSAGDSALTRASERLDERLELARGIRRHLERDIKLPEPEGLGGPAASGQRAAPPSAEN